MNGIKNSIAEYFPAVWYEVPSVHQNGKDFTLEVVGSVDKRTLQPVQNLRVSSKGTVVRTSSALPFAENTEIEFMGFYWLVEEVSIDLSAVNPQAVAIADVMRNATTSLTIKALSRTDITRNGALL